MECYGNHVYNSFLTQILVSHSFFIYFINVATKQNCFTKIKSAKYFFTAINRCIPESYYALLSLEVTKNLSNGTCCLKISVWYNMKLFVTKSASCSLYISHISVKNGLNIHFASYVFHYTCLYFVYPYRHTHTDR